MIIISTPFSPVFAVPTIDSPKIFPSAITVGVSTLVTISVQINDPTLIISSVNLPRLDDTGKVVAILGTLHDDGLNGDSLAADKRFTIQKAFTELNTGKIKLRVSAAFKGLLKRVFSEVIYLEIADAAAVIGPAGGSIKTQSGNSIDIPPGAVSQAFVFTLNQIPLDFFPDDLPESLTIVGAVEILPHGLIFNEPITLKMKLNDSTIPQGTIIPIVSYSPNLQKYSFEGWFGEVDDQGFVVCQEITHLSIFAGLFDKFLASPDDQSTLKKQVSDVLRRFVDMKNSLCIFRNTLLSFGNKDHLTAFINSPDLKISVNPGIDADAKYYYNKNLMVLKSKPSDLIESGDPNNLEYVGTQIYHELIHYIFDIERASFEILGYKYGPSHDENLAYYMDLVAHGDLKTIDVVSSTPACNEERYFYILNSARDTLSGYVAGTYRSWCIQFPSPCGTDPIPLSVLNLLKDLFGLYVDPQTMYDYYEARACRTCLRITSIDPGTAVKGEWVTFTLTGTGFQNGFTAYMVNESGEEWIIPLTEYVSPEMIRLTVFLDPRLTSTNRITIINPDGQWAEINFQAFESPPSPPSGTWAKTYGGTILDQALSIQQTSDGGYIVAGDTLSFGAGGYDLWVLKLNSNGDVIWQKTYGGASTDRFQSLQQTSDGGYILAGLTESFGTGNWHIWVLLLKLDSNGGVIWAKTYGALYNPPCALQSMGGCYYYSIQQTSDGGYILAGETKPFGAASTSISVLKLDNEGNVIWQKTYTNTGWDKAPSIHQTGDGGYIVAGETNFYTPYGYTGTDILVLKLDGNGNVVWQKTYGLKSYDWVPSIKQTSDGGYIMGCISYDGYNPAEILVLKIDSNGNVLWQKTYTGTSWVIPPSIHQTGDGGYIVACGTGFFGAGFADMWLLKLNSNGDILWQKTYGGRDFDYAHSIQQTSDGGYIVAGETYSFGGGGPNFWILKLDSNGNIYFNPLSGAKTLDTTATINDTFATIRDTNVSIQYTNVTPINTSIGVTNTNAIVSQQAP